MKVIAAINGSIVSQKCAHYALHYAKELSYDLVVLHIKNKKDLMEDVEESFEKISVAAALLEVNIEKKILKGHMIKTLKEYLSTINADTIFCSTRKNKNYITNSFSERLTKEELSVNIAVTRIVNLADNVFLDSIILPIKESKLSVKKFTFLSTMAKSYDAKVEIFSITTMSKNTMAHIDIKHAKEMLGSINRHLRHYLQLAKNIGFNIIIKHEFTLNEADSILQHIAKSNHQLVIIGAKRLTFFSKFLNQEPIEKILQNASVNTIAFYPHKD